MSETQWLVTFEYSIEITADTQEEADKLAWEDWTSKFGSVSATDFYMSEPWEIYE